MSPDVALPLLVGLPLGAAAVSLLLLGRPLVLQRTVSLVVLATMQVLSIVVVASVWDGSVVSVRVGAVDPAVGIVLAADPLGAIMLVVSSLMLWTVMVYAIGSQRTKEQAPAFHPLYLVLAAGVAASFLTADLFNLFVAFEVMLVASYVLITLGGSRDQVRHGMTYVVIGLLASTLFITAIGLVYAATGEVNLAALAVAMDQVPTGIRTALGLLLLVVFGVKAAIFPLFQWLPDSYPTAPSPVTALFAGLLTKVGVYAIIRTQTLLFPTGGEVSIALLVLAALTMTVGVVGAIAQNDIKRILSFHIVSQIGYMIFGLGLFTLAGIAGAVLYVVHHIVVKTTLFLVGGIVEERAGTGALDRLGGAMHTAPVLAVLFLLPALSLAGIPPFSGFVAKLSLAQSGFAAEQWVVTGVSLAVGLLTLFSMTKIWNGVFWGDPARAAVSLDREHVVAAPMTVATAILVTVSLAFVVAAGPLYDFSERAASVLLERGAYVQAVLR
ncbi:proton-conducting transporter membrane subunit [Salsipaludibacter albus]|uniref:proton-conducting transporter transmembrane domain-containing protein n=1 Tax=Salsipaludibacter albus TaxID=2849650 RepID=UPI001EE414B0|nr:proton-conducting transporter membrane subunit [Salsipaludibacter albus]MBY5162642.1 Na+/H+ antiporter subunit D [Salsipaludibacter albus]